MFVGEVDCPVMLRKCFDWLEQSKIPSPVALQILIYLANVWPYRKATNNVWVYSRI